MMLIFCAVVLVAAGSRQSISLDGAWDFTLIEPAAAGPGFANQTGSIVVPGAWQSQGCAWAAAAFLPALCHRPAGCQLLGESRP